MINNVCDSMAYANNCMWFQHTSMTYDVSSFTPMYESNTFNIMKGLFSMNHAYYRMYNGLCTGHLSLTSYMSYDVLTKIFNVSSCIIKI